ITKISTCKKTNKSTNSNIEVTKINDSFQEVESHVYKKILDKTEYKKHSKSVKKASKNNSKADKIFVLEFKGDLRASAVVSLREEISAIIAVAAEHDEVVLKLESPGGCVHDYGLAASQLARLRKHNIKLTVCVDKMAASGGYLMAVVANRIVAAPFAVIGSIGVILQLPNLNQFLKDKKINFEQITAGKQKRNLTLFGENTNEDRKNAKEQIEEVHKLFTDFVMKYRPNINIDKVATGRAWHAIDAIELNLIDEITTSDDTILKLLKSHNVFNIKKTIKKTFIQNILTKTSSYFML
ncbi:MAG: protease SohB, partial [Legionellales bacterium]|nr:protease SohB [Legionellales bacterium]